MKIVDVLALLLLIAGGINWGLMGVLNLNLVTAFFGTSAFEVHFIYILIGLAAFYRLFFCKKILDRWTKKDQPL